jgi:hypothetical protein
VRKMMGKTLKHDVEEQTAPGTDLFLPLQEHSASFDKVKKGFGARDQILCTHVSFLTFPTTAGS